MYIDAHLHRYSFYSLGIPRFIYLILLIDEERTRDQGIITKRHSNDLIYCEI